MLWGALDDSRPCFGALQEKPEQVGERWGQNPHIHKNKKYVSTESGNCHMVTSWHVSKASNPLISAQTLKRTIIASCLTSNHLVTGDQERSLAGKQQQEHLADPIQLDNGSEQDGQRRLQMFGALTLPGDVSVATSALTELC